MRNSKRSILVIGVLPPPLGGVTVHVRRVMDNLKESDIKASFIKTHHLLRLDSIKIVIKSKNIHVHSSNPYVRLLLALACLLFNKNSFLTYHGNLGRYGSFKNWIDSLSIRFYRWPIVINQASFKKAKRFNKASQLASAFIPPKDIAPLSDEIQEHIKTLKARVITLFCCNASNADLDKDGREIYQLTNLIALFNRHTEWGLVISDPSGSYKRQWERTGVKLEPNIILIASIHDFPAVIELSDVLIRFTTTDGDAISVKEALSLAKPVIATNVIDRPTAVHLVDDTIEGLEQLILNTDHWTRPCFQENGFEQLLQIYNKHLI